MFDFDEGNLDTTVEDLLNDAEAELKGEGASGGLAVLNVMVAVSALVSAILFWEYSDEIFAGVWKPAALVLGLLVGLLPAEGAFWAWKKIRGERKGMTARQIQVTGWGLGTSVFFSVYATVTLVVTGFSGTPESISMYSAWLVLAALVAPLPLQFVLFAMFAIADRAVVNNHQQAQAGALRLTTLHKFRMARTMSQLLGMKRALSRQLRSYGASVGDRGAESFLGGRVQTLTDLPSHQLPVGNDGALDPEVAAALEPPVAPSWLDRLTRRHHTAETTPAAAESTATPQAQRRGLELAAPLILYKLLGLRPPLEPDFKSAAEEQAYWDGIAADLAGLLRASRGDDVGNSTYDAPRQVAQPEPAHVEPNGSGPGQGGHNPNA